MPETPEFDQIARTLATEPDRIRDIAVALRLIWNARGAADVTKLERELSALMGVTASGPYVKNLDRAIRTLDR